MPHVLDSYRFVQSPALAILVELVRVAVDRVLSVGDLIDPQHMAPLVYEFLLIFRVHDFVGRALPDRHTREGARVTRCLAHQAAPLERRPVFGQGGLALPRLRDFVGALMGYACDDRAAGK